MSEKLKHLIESTISMPEFWKINYYMRSMKKAQHGGVFTNKYPNIFLKYYTVSSYLFFGPNAKIPAPIINVIDKFNVIIDDSNVDTEELLSYCLDIDKEYLGNPINGNRMYIATCGMIISPKEVGEMEHMAKVFSAINGEISYCANFHVDKERLAFLFVFTLIEIFAHKIYDVNEIKSHENFIRPIDKYGLCNITGAKFERQGFKLDDTYYLYNIFFDTSIGKGMPFVPKSIELILSISPLPQIFMRCDENLSVPYAQMMSTATVDFQKWRGITFSFDDVSNLLCAGKETIVHFDPQTLHKILLYIKSGTDENGLEFYHMNVEQLWNPEIFDKCEDIIITNYIHGTYYPASKTFEHIDFSVNQYSRTIFEAKYCDAENLTGISIGEYSDIHYKVWCVRGPNLISSVWTELVLASLDVSFREIFMESIGGIYKED